ncbi:MAG: hypothetical protein LW823_09600 [Rickettsiales bacterium]|jgi:hypothetical protein|nr:hypothetical protein [Rickettsiales bacterium]
MTGCGFYLRSILISSLCLLTACAGSERFTQTDTREEAGSLFAQTIRGSIEGAVEAAQSPLVDLNIKKQDIPEPLTLIAGNPYGMDGKPKCKHIQEEIATLDELLGADAHYSSDGKLSLNQEDAPDYVKDGAGMLQKEAIGFVAGKASIIPFRSIVRKVTGADKHSKAVARAYESGKIRRAYLRGVSFSMKCKTPKTELAKKI